MPSLTARWVKLVLGFGVSVAVGLAPYLGRVRVPLFTPLLSLIPESIQDVAIPLAAAVMGVVAVLIQWHGTHRPTHVWLGRWFRRVVGICLGALVALTVLEFLAVVRVPVPAVGRTVSFAVGPLLPNSPPCGGLSRADCITHKLTLDENAITTYFGETQVGLTKLALVLVYTLFMSMFGALVGLLLLADRGLATRV